MWKAILAGTAALAIVGSTLAIAQQRPGAGDGNRRGPATVEDMRAFGDARLAALRAGLVLNAEQQKHWPAFEEAARAMQQLRFDRINTFREARRNRDGDPKRVAPAERMRQKATRMSESGAALRKLADAMGPLYDSLDDAQKRRFAALSRMGGPRAGQGRFQRGGRDGGFQRCGRDGGPGWQQHRGQRRTDGGPEGAMPSAPTL